LVAVKRPGALALSCSFWGPCDAARLLQVNDLGLQCPGRTDLDQRNGTETRDAKGQRWAAGVDEQDAGMGGDARYMRIATEQQARRSLPERAGKSDLKRAIPRVELEGVDGADALLADLHQQRVAYASVALYLMVAVAEHTEDRCLRLQHVEHGRTIDIAAVDYEINAREDVLQSVDLRYADLIAAEA
jgi:hypothetical protein